jgi:Co/Zn/Cd efflux system component
VLFLLEARKILSRWYLAVPLCVLMFLLVIAGIFIYFSGKTFLVDPINTAETLWIVVMALLSPCSVLLFLSSYGHDSLTKVYLVVSSAASIFSILFLILALIEIARWSSIEDLLLPLVFYLVILMPAMGVCFLSKATMYRRNDDAEKEL